VESTGINDPGQDIWACEAVFPVCKSEIVIADWTGKLTRLKENLT
jgi:hypothetical protein